MIRAILRAQLLSMRVGWGRRGIAMIAGAVWYALWLFVAAAAGLALAGAPPEELRQWLPAGLLGVCAYWQLMPVLSASMGSSLDLRKLRVYPVPHRKLFAIEVLLRLTTGVEMLLVLGAGAAGLASNASAGGEVAVARLAAALPLFVFFNLLLSSGTRSLLERLLSRRKVREIAAVLVALLWAIPRLLEYFGYSGGMLARAAASAQSLALPWTAAARAALGESELPALASLALWTVAAGWFGRRQFERGLRHDAAAAEATPARANSGRAPATERFYRIPSSLWRDPLAGIVEKELRTLARTPRFRTVFLMGFTFGLVVWLPVAVNRHGPAEPWFLTAVAVYALTLLGQVSYWNSLGFDRSAAAFYFAAPLPFARVLIGKNIAAMTYILLEVLIVIAVTAALRLASGWQPALETVAVTVVCSMYLLGLGNWGSVRYPRGLSGERASQGGGGRGFHGFLFLIYPVALLPVGLAYLARYAFASELMFALGLAIAAIIGGAFYRVALESAVSLAGERRERIVAELSISDGPVTGD